MKKLIVLLFLFPFLGIGQESEVVNFEKDMTIKKWIRFSQKAKKEGKFVFLFLYYHQQNIEESTYSKYYKPVLEDLEVSDYLNSNFINIFLERDFQENTDPEQNSIAKRIMSTFNIYTFPSCIVFNDSGKFVHKFTGINKPKDFLEKIKLSFNNELNYTGLIEKFDSGERSFTFFEKLFNVLNNASDTTDKYLLEFIKSRENLFTKENAEVIMNSNSCNVGFDYLHNNQNVWKNILGERVLDSFYVREMNKQTSRSYYFLFQSKVNIDSFINAYDIKCPKFGKGISAKFLLSQELRQQKNNGKAAYILQNNYDAITASMFYTSEYNYYAWQIFQNIDNTILLNKALSWSKKSLEQDKDNPAYLDTYANILYKLGQTKEAIEIETKAVELVEIKQKKTYQETLDKMQKSKPTWK